MPSTVSLRLPDSLLAALDRLAKLIDRPRSFLIRKALQNYLSEYADYQIALDRLRDKDDRLISAHELKKNLGL
jgi:RHH-type rel operon transcriptional repressor/antitoxin RelB